MASKAVTVISGGERVKSEGIVGSTIDQVRADYHDVLNIPGDATATVNGNAVAKTYRLVGGDEVVFSRPLGQKGV